LLDDEPSRGGTLAPTRLLLLQGKQGNARAHAGGTIRREATLRI
jgi:hypothetical protein